MEDLEAQILYGITILGYYPTDFDYKLFDNYPKSAKAIYDLKAEDKEIDLVGVLAKAGKQEVDRWFNLSVSSDYLAPVKQSPKLINERLDTLLKLKVEKEIQDRMIFDWDVEIVAEKISKLQKKGVGRFISGEELKALAKKFLEEKKEASMLYNLEFLDKATKGIQPSQYVIVAGRPSVGKSAFLQWVGLKNAEKGKRVLFVSVEMGEELIIERILKSYQVETIPTTFNILTTGSTAGIEKEIEKRKKEIDLVLVDYIQLLAPSKRVRDLYERVTEISSELKKMATKYSLPFICASQYSRQAEGRQPRLSDLRESGALEQDADVVISLYKEKSDEELNENKDLKIVRVDLLKNRQGYTFSNGDGKDYRMAFVISDFSFKVIDEAYV